MGLHKRWFCKRSNSVDENTIEVTLFFKGGKDVNVRIDVKLLAAALGVEERLLKKVSGAELVTIFFKKPDLINTGKLTIKNQRLLLEAIEGMFKNHGGSEGVGSVLSFQNIDYYLGKTEGSAQRAIANKVEKKFA
ncbi:MAG: hypothetical protein Q8Q56_05255 [Alphaproteobacteria bacterium]|nr:hypothetical protein [Alphaproteobacteria bacterium]